MKIDEILNVPDQSERMVDISSFDLDNAPQVAMAENIPLYHVSNGNTELYFLKTNQVITYVLCSNAVVGDVNYLVIHHTHTTEPFRNKGYATALYSALVNKLNKRLISDDEQAPFAKQIWKNVDKVMDVKTNEILPRSQVNPTDLYVDGSKPTDKSRRYRLVYESAPTLLGTPYSLETNKIIGDNLIATHPDNEGKYD